MSAKVRPRFFGRVAQGVGVEAEVLVLRRRVGQRPAEVFLPQRRQQHDAGLCRGQRVQQDVQPVHELRQAGRAVERLVAAVADDDDRGIEGEDVVLEAP